MSNSATKNYYDDLIGKEINGYLVEKKLGEGGMGAVFKASKITDKTLIALKVISPMLLVNSRFVKRFQREAKVGKVLAHPNIIQVLEFGETENGLLFMAMEFVDGGTLRSEISKEGSLDIKRTSEILKQLCEAMEAAHKRGILHRDLKPENIMLTKDAEGKELVKLADFGLVKLTQPDGEITKGSALTEVGEIFGTPHFMSPEQIMGQTVGAPADIYSLGVILYQMMTGKTPLEGTDVRNLLVTKISQDIPPPSQKFPSVSKVFDEVFKNVLARSPEDRYNSASEFYNAFSKAVYLLENPSAAKTVNPPALPKEESKKTTPEQKISSSETVSPPSPKQMSEKSSNKLVLPIAVGAIALILITLIILFARQ
jgi:serine/threonine-protein kinase